MSSSRSSVNMLRTRRRDNNVKPNRRDFRAGRLDRKSSRGMIYENEELRLRTININAEIERGQYDIKKLKKENELLKKEIWCLRDEYEKLDKLLKEKSIDFSSSSTTTTSTDSDTTDSDDVENSQNLENDQKTNMRALTRSFAALSVVPEDSAENSDRTSKSLQLDGDVIHPDQSYPSYERSATLKMSGEVYEDATNFYQNVVTLEKAEVDVMAKMDNREFSGRGNSRSTFSNGGNLEELLNDIETISQDILAISGGNQDRGVGSRRCKSDVDPDVDKSTRQVDKPFKSELNVTLMPQPMPLIGLEKYREIQRSMNTTPSKSMENLTGHVFPENQMTEKKEFNHFQQSSTDVSISRPLTPINQSFLPTQPNHLPPYLSNLKDNYVSSDYFARYNPENFQTVEKTPTAPKILVKKIEENDESCVIKQESENIEEKPTKKEKLGLRKKVSIHFRGKKEKQKESLEVPGSAIKKHSPVRDKKINEDVKTKISHQKTSSKDSNKTTSESDTKNNADVKKLEAEKKCRKSASASPDRKKTRDEKKCKKHKKERTRIRRATVTSLDSRGRSHSVATERSNTYGFFYDDYMNSERDSMSSSETLKTRQINFSNVPMAGKVPWCGCWGNGCI